MTVGNARAQQDKSNVIVIGNEKGGTGKSTVSMHLVVYLLRLGFKVGTIDIDARQGTLSRYVNNREKFCAKSKIDLEIPIHYAIYKSENMNIEKAREEEESKLLKAIQQLSSCDFVIIDTPGTDSFLSRVAHSYADLLITPLNDSFIDLDVLGTVDPDTGDIIKPSQYAEMVWEQKKQKALRRENTFAWIVMRNRLSNLYAKNKEDMHKSLQALSKRIGFQTVQGFSERVIFRELFLKGLTVIDLPKIGGSMSMSHVAARQELRNLLSVIKLPKVQSKLDMAG